MSQSVFFVCKSCAYSKTDRKYMGQFGGFHLLNQLTRLHQTWSLRSEFTIQPVDCLGTCDRPCAIALAATAKATLLFGDLPPFQSAAALLKLGEQYAASADGVVPRRDRPEALKACLIACIPPLPARSTAV